MKVLVTGSRSIDDDNGVLSALYDSPFDPDTVIHGDGSRVDELGGVWGVHCDADIETHPVPEWAWEEVGTSAGPLRNSYMVSEADAVVAIWDGESNGTKDTFQKAESDGLPVYKVVVNVDDGGQIEERIVEKLVESDQQRLTAYESDDG